MQRRRRLTWIAVFGFVPILLAFLCLPTGSRIQRSVLVNVFVSFLGFWATRWLTPIVAKINSKAGLIGKDINKRGTPAGNVSIPEALGLAMGVVYLLCLILFEQLHVLDATSYQFWSEPETTGWIVDYNAALATICFILLLGFVDDVLDIPWRVKLILPAIASLPLLVSYSGGTGISIPIPLRSHFGSYLELGLLYKLFMVFLTIFCTNAINILAGVNGLETGQTYFIACAISTHNLIEILSRSEPSIVQGHLFSLFLMLPLAMTTFALMGFNWYPAQVFVGDTFTYGAGMAIAVAGILGHFSETLLIFLIPQLFNFVYSLPQLFHIVPCPRHRLPRPDVEKGTLHPTANWNLVNLTLQLFGPCTEEWLCIRILVMQYGSCGFAFFLRWCLKGWYK